MIKVLSVAEYCCSGVCMGRGPSSYGVKWKTTASLARLANIRQRNVYYERGLGGKKYVRCFRQVPARGCGKWHTKWVVASTFRIRTRLTWAELNVEAKWNKPISTWTKRAAVSRQGDKKVTATMKKASATQIKWRKNYEINIEKNIKYIRNNGERYYSGNSVPQWIDETMKRSNVKTHTATMWQLDARSFAENKKKKT